MTKQTQALPPAVNIVILTTQAGTPNQPNQSKPITLRQLEELFILQPEFRGQTCLRYNQILEFCRKHPQLAVRVSAITGGK